MSNTKRRSFGFDPDEAPVSGNREQQPRPEELIDVLEMPKGKKGASAFKQVRPFGNVVVTGVHWVKTKKRDGSIGSFSKPCANFNPSTGRRDHDGNCPWCKAQEELEPLTKKGEQAYVRFSSDYWINVIDRDLQENAPAKKPKLTPEERESGVKDKESDSWTPVRGHRLTGQDLKKVRNLKDLNVVKKGGERVGVSVFDVERGCDIHMKFDKEEKVPSNRWTFAIAERTPLTEEEQGYLIQDLGLLINDSVDIKAEKAEVDQWMARMGLKKAKSEDDEDEDEDDDQPKRRSSKEVTNDMRKKAKKAVDDLDEDDDDDDEDDDAPPAKAKKVAPAKGKKLVVDEDDDDEDDEDEPPAKSKAKAPAKKKPVVDEDDDDEDDDDDEPPAKSKKPATKPSAKKKPVVDEDDDEDDEGDEDDEPPAKSKKPVAKGKKPVVDDDDDDDEDDEDDEPPARKSKVKVPPPPKGKQRKPANDDDDDDDDDDIPF